MLTMPVTEEEGATVLPGNPADLRPLFLSVALCHLLWNAGRQGPLSQASGQPLTSPSSSQRAHPSLYPGPRGRCPALADADGTH